MGEKIEISNKIDKNEWVQEQLKKTFSKEIGDLGNNVRKSLETNLNNDKIIKTLEEGKRRLENNGNKFSNIFGNGNESKESKNWKGEYRGAGFTLALQIALNKIEGINISADGIYGPELKNALIKFQKDNGLKSDGIAGVKTLETIIFQLKGNAIGTDIKNLKNNIKLNIPKDFGTANILKQKPIFGIKLDRTGPLRGKENISKVDLSYDKEALKKNDILREINASKVIVDKIKAQYNIEPKDINRIAKNDKINGIDVVILQSTNLRNNIELAFTKTNKQSKYPFKGSNYADKFLENITFTAWSKIKNGGDFYNLKIKESPDKNNPLFKGLISLEAKKQPTQKNKINNAPSKKEIAVPGKSKTEVKTSETVLIQPNQKEIIEKNNKLGSEIVSQIEDMLIPSVEKKLNNISGLKNFMINYINGLNPEKQKTLLNAVEEGELDEDTKKIILDNFDLMNDGQKKTAKDILDKNSDFIKSVSKELDGTEEGKFLLKLLGKLGWNQKTTNSGVTVEVIEKPKDNIKNENLKKLEDAKNDLEMIDVTILGKNYKIGNMKYINKLESDIRKSYEIIDQKEYNINKGYLEKDKKQIQEYIEANKNYLSNQRKLIPTIKPDSLISKTYEAVKNDLNNPKNDFQSKQKLSMDIIKYNQSFEMYKNNLLSTKPSAEFEKNLKLFEQGESVKIKFGDKRRDIEKAK